MRCSSTPLIGEFSRPAFYYEVVEDGHGMSPIRTARRRWNLRVTVSPCTALGQPIHSRLGLRGQPRPWRSLGERFQQLSRLGSPRSFEDFQRPLQP